MSLGEQAELTLANYNSLDDSGNSHCCVANEDLLGSLKDLNCSVTASSTVRVFEKTGAQENVASA